MLHAGAAREDISPADSQFLFGYPHVERLSTGIHDPLMSAALCLSNGDRSILFCSNDIIFIPRASAARIRRAVSATTGIPEAGILISATHTHSGPITVDCLSNEADPVVPRADPRYLAFMEERIIAACTRAAERLAPARAGMGIADATGVGTNRRDPAGPRDPQVPVLLVRPASGEAPIACMLLYCMHPTVLHEDSRLVSADFPGMARQYLGRVLGAGCTVLYHTGPEGNQSPRHVTRGNTFAEAGRLGEMLGRAVERVVPAITCRDDLTLEAGGKTTDLPRRGFPPVEEAEEKLARARARLETLRLQGAPRQEARTAECDLFGAEETVTLARAARDGRIAETYRACLPAEIQVLKVGPWAYVGWPGEVFVEYGLRVRAAHPGSFVINLANGELQGYIVTEEAAREGGYEASNALFSHESGDILVRETLELLGPAPRA
jgi:neutral ceramidase